MANELGLRSVCFELNDLAAMVDVWLPTDTTWSGDIGQYENIWRMAYVRGSEGIVVALAEQIG